MAGRIKKQLAKILSDKFSMTLKPENLHSQRPASWREMAGGLANWTGQPDDINISQIVGFNTMTDTIKYKDKLCMREVYEYENILIYEIYYDDIVTKEKTLTKEDNMSILNPKRKCNNCGKTISQLTKEYNHGKCDSCAKIAAEFTLKKVSPK